MPARTKDTINRFEKSILARITMGSLNIQNGIKVIIGEIQCLGIANAKVNSSAP